jgi:hypothetical protein
MRWKKLYSTIALAFLLGTFTIIPQAFGTSFLYHPLIIKPPVSEEVGSTRCGDILETQFGKRFNLTDPAQGAEYRAAGAIEKCGAVVHKGVRIAAEILLARPA